jgi:hypothetical protein
MSSKATRLERSALPAGVGERLDQEISGLRTLEQVVRCQPCPRDLLEARRTCSRPQSPGHASVTLYPPQACTRALEGARS